MSDLIRSVYDRTIRPRLPRKIASFNGVAVRQPRLFDSTDFRPQYEETLVEKIRSYVNPGQTVLVVGGGWGVSSVEAARQTGPDGSVSVYEVSADRVSNIEETLRLNMVEDRVSVSTGAVGTPVRVPDGQIDGDIVKPESLASHDVLVLDCEGSEIDIIERMTIDPETVIVETHPMFDAPPDRVETLLTDAGYEVINRQSELVETGEIVILVARQRDIED